MKQRKRLTTQFSGEVLFQPSAQYCAAVYKVKTKHFVYNFKRRNIQIANTFTSALKKNDIIKSINAMIILSKNLLFENILISEIRHNICFHFCQCCFKFTAKS